MKYKNNIIKIIVIIFISIFTTILIYKNPFQVVKKEIVEDYQIDSQSLVLSKIKYDSIHAKNKWGLYFSYNSDETIFDYYELNHNFVNCNPIKYKGYESQIGLQGTIFSFLYNKLKIEIGTLKLLTTMALSTILTIISCLFLKKYGKIFSIVFYLTTILSPWIIMFSSNLYWVIFTWFIPLIFSLLILVDNKRYKIYLSALYLSILLKCCCGYEYISSVMMLTIFFHIIEFFQSKEKKEKQRIIKMMFLISIVCIIAFMTALIIHGKLRGGSVINGINKIWQEDVKRRTFGNPNKLPSVYKESLQASPLIVLKKYFNWNTEIIYLIKGYLFVPLIIINVIILSIQFFLKKINRFQLLIFILTFLTTISWLFLAKGHSYIHTHINFVLWYFGFVQVLFYIPIENLIILLKKCKERKIK